MRQLLLRIEGVNRAQVKELLDDLNKIEGVNAGYHITESHSEVKGITIPHFEVKEIVVPIVIGLGTSVAGDLITFAIIKFLEKQKSLDAKPIVIKSTINNYGTIKIVQGDDKNNIENNITEAIGKTPDFK